MTTVLVLDDGLADREQLATALRYVGYTVLEAPTADEARSLVRSHRPDLVVADILLTTMDVVRFVRELRREPATAEIRVVFWTSSYAVDETRSLAAAVGLSQILVKPASPEKIVAVVEESVGWTPKLLPAAAENGLVEEHLRPLNIKLLERVNQLEERNALLESLQRSAPVGLGFIDRDFRIQRMNEPLAAVNGAPLEQQLGRTVAEVVPHLWPQLEPMYRQVLDTGEAVVNRTVLGGPSPPEGDQRSWLTNLYAVQIDGAVIGIGLVAVEIT
jgi:CheY-like chemotaxis protein